MRTEIRWMDGITPKKNKPGENIDKVQTAQKPEKPDLQGLVTSLRSDMVPSSAVLPARQSILQHDTLIVATGIALGLIIVGMLLFTVIGPGRPILEQNLAILAHQGTTTTPTSTPSPTLIAVFTASEAALTPTSTDNPVPTKTATPSPRSQATKTAVVRDYISPTATVFTQTPTVVPCREATSISLADVGQTMCVMGVVLNTIASPTSFMVIFSYDRGAFYWVSYDVVWSKAKKNACYEIKGKIEQIATSPMLVFGYKNMPEACP